MSWNVLEIFDKCLGLSYIETTIFENWCFDVWFVSVCILKSPCQLSETYWEAFFCKNLDYKILSK